MVVDTVIGDGAYSEKDNLDDAEDNEVELVAQLSKTVTHGTSKVNDKFEYNKDAEMDVCQEGHMAKKKTNSGSRKDKNGSNTQVELYHFDADQWKRCPSREGCYKEGAKSTTFSVNIKDPTHLKQMDFMETEHFKEKARERYKIEALHAHLKNDYSYRTTHVVF